MLLILGAREQALIYPAMYLLLVFIHVGVRMACKSHVVDMIRSDLRTAYVTAPSAEVARAERLPEAGRIGVGEAYVGHHLTGRDRPGRGKEAGDARR